MADTKLRQYAEVWKYIEGCEGRYQVSNMGRVRSVDHYVTHRHGGPRLVKGRILKPMPNNCGYMQVAIRRNGRTERPTVHRLVMEAFNPIPPDTRLETNHVDGNKANNRLDNLEIVTHQENIQHGYDTGLITPHGRRIAA